MARKVRGFERVLDAPALFAVAYDEIGSSIYFALGIVAAQALGLTPVVLLATGLLFLVVSLSYAEGTAAIPETASPAPSRYGRSPSQPRMARRSSRSSSGRAGKTWWNAC